VLFPNKKFEKFGIFNMYIYILVDVKFNLLTISQVSYEKD